MPVLPSGSNILSSSTLGATHGAIQRKIQVLLPGEKHHEYFLKLFILEQTADMARGEHEATKHWWKLLPDNVPRPWGWGECANRPGIFFVLLDYVHMDTDFDKLDVHRFLSRLCHVHAQSSSPTGKFGFPYTTFAGTHANDNSWCDTWEEYLVRDFKTLMRCEMETHGLDQELEQLEEQIITRVVPRLIRPLETGGRHIRPTLVHGDLWHGNIGTNVATGEPVMYDFGSFYAHDECKTIRGIPPSAMLDTDCCQVELTMWNAERYLLKQDHRNLYWKLRKMGSDGAHGERDQPDVALHGEEVDYESKDDPERKDRNLLYARSVNLCRIDPLLWLIDKN